MKIICIYILLVSSCYSEVFKKSTWEDLKILHRTAEKKVGIEIDWEKFSEIDKGKFISIELIRSEKNPSVIYLHNNISPSLERINKHNIGLLIPQTELHMWFVLIRDYKYENKEYKELRVRKLALSELKNYEDKKIDKKIDGKNK